MRQCINKTWLKKYLVEVEMTECSQFKNKSTKSVWIFDKKDEKNQFRKYLIHLDFLVFELTDLLSSYIWLRSFDVACYVLMVPRDTQCTVMQFTSFLSGRFRIEANVNSLDIKLVKSTSVQCSQRLYSVQETIVPQESKTLLLDLPTAQLWVM